MNAVQQQLLPATQEALKFHKVEFDNVPKLMARDEIQMTPSNAHCNASLVAHRSRTGSNSYRSTWYLGATDYRDIVSVSISIWWHTYLILLMSILSRQSSKIYFSDGKFSVPTGLEFSKVDWSCEMMET